MDTNRLHIRPFAEEDIPAVRELFDQGRDFQRSLGFVQWLEGYPSTDILMADINLRRGYVFEYDGKIAGYASIFLSGDEEYERLGHIWHTSAEYGVIHRLVLSDEVRGKHLAASVLAECEDIIRRNGLKAARVDTGVFSWL